MLHRKRLFWIWSLLLIVVVLVVNHQVRSRPAPVVPNPISGDPSLNGSSILDSLPGRQNYLIMGVDHLEEVNRSDAMILVSLESNKPPFVMSIPRDTRVKLLGRGFDKINHAYAFGGPNLSVQTASDFLGIPIDGYFVVNLDAFSNIVDALEGVTLDVEKRMYYEDPYQDLVIDLYPGVQKLNGNKAMQYVRFRDEHSGDIGRVQRQQKFLTAVAKEATKPTNILKMPALIRESYAAIDTNLNVSQIIRLATAGASLYDKGLDMVMVPGVPEYVGPTSYWLPDISSTRLLVAERLLSEKEREKYLAYSSEIAAIYQRSVEEEERQAALKRPPVQEEPSAQEDEAPPEERQASGQEQEPPPTSPITGQQPPQGAQEPQL